MIAFIEGQVAEVRKQSAIVRTGPVGLEVFAPASTLGALRKGESVTLHTYLVVKEDLLALYGFRSGDEHTLFTHLITVSGVGPKLALAIMSTLPAPTVARAITDGDAALLATSPGVGKRTAERLILELAGRLPEELMAEAPAGRSVPADSGAALDAVSALLALGFREAQVRSLVAELAAAQPDDGPEALIRKALARLR